MGVPGKPNATQILVKGTPNTNTKSWSGGPEAGLGPPGVSLWALRVGPGILKS